MTTKPMYDPMAYELGCKARIDNQPLDTCTYADKHLIASWEAGWRDMNQTLNQKKQASGSKRA